jgi:hypothetical protein
VRLLQPATERPPEGLARGRWEAPGWAIVLLGIAVVLGAAAYLVLRARARRQASAGPISRRKGRR